MSSRADRKVVVPIDFSGEAAPAIRAAKEHVEQWSQIYLIHVLVPLDIVSPGVRLGTVTNESREKAVRKKAEELLKLCGCEGAQVVVRIGNVGLEIAEYAEEIGADLIVIPSHGYHGMQRLLLGSTTERVIRHARCSVLVLRRGDAN